MSTQILTELPDIQYAGMDYDSVIAEIQKIIKNNPKWAENWDTFHSSEAGVMFIQLMAWICDNLSTRQDTLYNEQYLSTAQKKSSKIRLLKTIGYKPALTHAAQVPLKFSNVSPISDDEIEIVKGIENDTLLSRIRNIPKIDGLDINGNKTSWEILPLSGDKPEYLDGIRLSGGSAFYDKDSSGNTIFAVQGETNYKDMKVTTSDGLFLNLEKKNIAANSIRIYLKSSKKECQEVTSFVSKEALSNKYGIPYIIEYNEDETLKIRFADKETLKDDRRLKAGDSIFVFYRTTNGKLGNIPPKFINTNYIFSNVKGKKISIDVYNDTLAYNGADNEELDKAVLNAPLTLRTLDRAVTPEDFDILINANPSVLKSKTYTASNIPNKFKNYYGRYINPQEAFVFTLLNKSYKNSTNNKAYEDVPTSEYNNFPWINLIKRNMLNEEYSFGSGKLNEPISYSKTYNELKINIPNGEFTNGIIMNLGDTFDNKVKENPNNENFKLKINTIKIDEEVFDKIPYGLIDNSELSNSKYTGLTDGKNDITEEVFARFISKNSFEKDKAVNLKDAQYVNISIDKRVNAIINLWEEREPGFEEGSDYYLYWDNVPRGQIVGDDGSIKQAGNRNGIIQLINRQLLGITVGDGTMEGNTTANMFNKTTAYQYFGLKDMTGNKNILTFDDTINQYDFLIKIKDLNFDFIISKEDVGNDGVLTYKKFVDIANALLSSNSPKLKVYSDERSTWEKISTFNTFEEDRELHPEKMYFRLVQSLDNDVDYDIFLCSTESELFSGNTIDVDYDLGVVKPEDGNPVSMIHKLHQKDIDTSKDAKQLLGANFEAVEYKDLAKMLDDPSDDKKYYFSITSPTIGKDSCMYFKKGSNDKSEKFVTEILETPFSMNKKEETFRAYGIKRVCLLNKQVIGNPTYIDIDGDKKATQELLDAGNIIFENSCIYNNYDFFNLYSSYKFDVVKTLKIGSKFNNFYYTGDKNIDDPIKESDYKFSKPTGVVFKENGDIDLNRSNIEIKFTSSKVNNNSFYSINKDNNKNLLDVIKNDRTVISTSTIENKEEFNLPLKFSLDDLTEEFAWEIYFGKAVTGREIVKTIKQAILDKNIVDSSGKNIYKEFIENVDSIIRNYYFESNAVQLSNLSKKENGNITFYYADDIIDNNFETIEFYKNFLGTSITNQKLYELYPKEIADKTNMEDNIVYLDENGKETTEKTKEYLYIPKYGIPLTFKYRKLVNNVSRGADYYIDYRDGEYFLEKTENSLFTDGVFYMHLINDRTGDVDDSGMPIITDESNLNAYMNNKKISGMDIVWLQPYIKTYDIAAEIYYNANYTQEMIKPVVEKAVKDLCSIENADIGGYMSQSKINRVITDCEGVVDVDINYFGFNYQSGEGSEKRLKAKFYEMLCLADYEEKKHGIQFSYKKVSDIEE